MLHQIIVHDNFAIMLLILQEQIALYYHILDIKALKKHKYTLFRVLLATTKFRQKFYRTAIFDFNVSINIFLIVSMVTTDVVDNLTGFNPYLSRILSLIISLRFWTSV
jgi:hypothetical protein